jgi:hypothetical protein
MIDIGKAFICLSTINIFVSNLYVTKLRDKYEHDLNFEMFTPPLKSFPFQHFLMMSIFYSQLLIKYKKRGYLRNSRIMRKRISSKSRDNFN